MAYAKVYNQIKTVITHTEILAYLQFPSPEETEMLSFQSHATHAKFTVLSLYFRVTSRL